MREGDEVHTGDLRPIDEERTAIRGCSHVIHLAAIVGGYRHFTRCPHAGPRSTRLYTPSVRAAWTRGGALPFYVSSSMVF